MNEPRAAATSRIAGALIVAASTLGVLFTPAPARAYSVDGKVGVGYEETLISLADGGVGTPDVRAAGLGGWIYIGDLGLELILGLRTLLLSGQPVDLAGFVTAGAHYNVFRAPRVNLSAGLRVDTGFARAVDGNGNATAFRVGVALEVPLRAVYFLSEQFSISASVGPVVAFNGSDANPLTGARNSTSLSLFSGGFSGGIGFTVWLR